MGIGGLRAHHCGIATKCKRAESQLIALRPASDRGVCYRSGFRCYIILSFNFYQNNII